MEEDEIKAIEFPNKTFATKEELFVNLKSNEEKIISLKKSIVYDSTLKSGIAVLDIHGKQVNSEIKSDVFKEGFIYPIISTTRFKDSHNDVHFDGCFKKTVKEKQGKIKYILDHDLKYDSVIAWEKSVEMIVANLDWSMVGKKYEGNTEALMFKIAKESIRRKDVLEDIENKVSDFENSIRMIYYKIKLGLNSELKDHKENKKYFDKRIESIVNKDEVMELGYFWGVEELGIHKEGSLVTAGGSNSATSIYEVEPLKSTQEPLKSTQEIGEKKKRRRFV